MTAPAELLTQNLELVCADENFLVERIYHEFFTRYPEAKELFCKYSEPGKRQMVRETFMYAIDHLEGAPWVASNLLSLGRKHYAYEVTDEMYAWFTESILRVFAEISGSQWNTELEGHWRDLLTQLSDFMLQAEV